MIQQSKEKPPSSPSPGIASPVQISTPDAALVFCESGAGGGLPGLPAAEWWFVHGWYNGTSSPRRYFMCTFFRFTQPDTGNGRPLHHLILADLDPETGVNATSSQADPGISGWIDRSIGSDLDPDLVTAYRDELRESGVPSAIITGPPDPSVSGHPFTIRWGDFALSGSRKGASLSFRRQGDQVACRFTLEPASLPWYSPGFPFEGRDVMAYASIPHLEIRGTAGGSSVIGEAWMDHQWGGLGWFGNPATGEGTGPRISGWDWYGVSLSSGVHIMVLVHRDMADRRIRSPWCLVLEPGGKKILIQDFSFVLSGSWTSPRTGITYPLTADISFPGCRLRITPLAPDQEIAIPGPMRAVWEGAAGVEGTYDGRPAAGTARIELCGYGYIFDFDQVLESMSREIDSVIGRSFPPELDEDGIDVLIGGPGWQGEPLVYREMIVGPAWELIRRNKKFYRPLYAILMLQTLGVDSGPYLDLICCIPELTHTGALIIDDIEDNSTLRRGGPCIHRLYGRDTAINAANALYYLPWLLVEHHPRLDDSQRLLFYRNMVKSAVRAHIGQGTDIWLSHQGDPEQILSWADSGIDRKILQMHADKTGIAGEQIAEGCCIIANAPPAVRKACTGYSRDLWTGFQIMDDIRDITGGNGGTKIPGEDIAAGKMSYVIAKALTMLGNRDRRRLASILSADPQAKDTRTIEEGLVLVRQSGAVDVCRQEVQELSAASWKQFASCTPPSEARVMLRAFAARMLRE